MSFWRVILFLFFLIVAGLCLYVFFAAPQGGEQAFDAARRSLSDTEGARARPRQLLAVASDFMSLIAAVVSVIAAIVTISAGRKS